MQYRLLADSGCTDGSCPTFFVNSAGDVRVRGYDPVDPNREVEVDIPATKWAVLMANMASGGR